MKEQAAHLQMVSSDDAHGHSTKYVCIYGPFIHDCIYIHKCDIILCNFCIHRVMEPAAQLQTVSSYGAHAYLKRNAYMVYIHMSL